jgi:membrane associated rhomboid family serine protease
MYTRQTLRSSGGFGGLAGPPIPDLVAVIAVLFATWTLQFFAATAAIPAWLRLWPAALTGPHLWQLVTYAFVGWGNPDLWFLLELLILYWFGADVFRRLGRARFWRLLLLASACSALVAAGSFLVLTRVLGVDSAPSTFPLVQGQRVLLTIATAAFALLYSDATVLLFFVLPMPARYFLWLPVVAGFVAFLPTKDLSGFLGICCAVLATFLAVGRRGRAGGGSWWSGISRRWREHRLRQLRKRSGLRVVDRDKSGPDLTIN